jgi:hypothetical protein
MSSLISSTFSTKQYCSSSTIKHKKPKHKKKTLRQTFKEFFKLSKTKIYTMMYLSWAWKQPNLHNFLNQNKNLGKLSSKFKSRNKKNKNNNITCVRQISNKILLHEQ